MKHPLAENRIIYKLPHPKIIVTSYFVKFGQVLSGWGVKVYRELRQQDELSVREPTEDKLPTTFSGQKEAIRSLSTLLGLHKKENRFPQALFGACFVEKLTTEDWPGPVLASLNMSAKGYGQ